jgi:hypothetical protein
MGLKFVEVLRAVIDADRVDWALYDLS